MAKINLNREYNYTIDSPYRMKSADNDVLRAFVIMVKEDWTKDCYDDLKTKLKVYHLRKQTGRCAYCRNWIAVDGKYEPIEHIVAKSLKPKWMFKVRNLVISCDTCNGYKGTKPTLQAALNNRSNFPNRSDAFLIFNPHFDKWSENFKIEDDVFLVAKPNSKGEATIEICELFRYHVPINNARNRQMTLKNSAKAITQRLRNTNPNDPNYAELILALDYYDRYLH